MAKRFDAIKVGDQVQMPASRHYLTREDKQRDPDRPVAAAVVTHRWYDPVERKDYVALAEIRVGGADEHPRAKHTIRGLAQAGWQWATEDWLAHAKAVGDGTVIPLRGRPKRS